MEALFGDNHRTFGGEAIDFAPFAGRFVVRKQRIQPPHFFKGRFGRRLQLVTVRTVKYQGVISSHGIQIRLETEQISAEKNSGKRLAQP